MEGPVLTTPSSHRLRSAVGACAQPRNSYFGSASTYLGARIQCGTENSGGGCIRKFHCISKTGESTVLDKLNLTKRGGSGGSDEIPKSGCRRSRPAGAKTCLNQYCGFKSTPSRVQPQSEPTRKHRRNERTGGGGLPGGGGPGGRGQVEDQDERGTGKVTATRGTVFPGDVGGKCERGLGEGRRSGSENDLCGGVCGIASAAAAALNGSAKILNYCTKTRAKVTKKNVKKNGGGGGADVLLFGKNLAIGIEKISDECYNCGGREDDHVDQLQNERQEISKWQPKHAVTRRTAQIVRKIRNAWEKRVGASRLVAAENIQLLFNDLQLFVSASQVAEMLKCAQERSENPTSKHLTFGEFYKIANDLIRTEIASASPSPRVPEENVDRQRRKVSRSMSKNEVFLGGSCNPTTWRTDLAIPELEKMNISYYNPQVEEWRPELLEVEYQAKENATVMFFVIDNQTRGVSALIEVAHLAGNERKLILVIQSYTQQKQIISNEEISQKEYEDLKTGQEVLRDLVERQRIPVFTDIMVALKATEKVLREGIAPQDLQGGNCTTKKENSPSPREVFDELDRKKTGKIQLEDVCLAIKLLYRRSVSFKRLETFVRNPGNNLNGIQLESGEIDFDGFVNLTEQYERQQQQGQDIERTCFLGFNFPSVPGDSVFDLYLGGTLENTTWRESIAVPMLTSENLRYFAPNGTEGRKELTRVEVAAMETSFVLLFVITRTARSIAAMAIAGHYIGRGANVVLCVEHLPHDAQVGSEVLTERAVKDYNRGRMYLTDIAKRTGVAVFEEVCEAVRCAVDKCRESARNSQ